MNPQTMTCEECRDELARMDGWHKTLRHRHASGVEQWCWERDGGDESFAHPHPPTLDGAAKALPEGWYVRNLNHFQDGWDAAAHSKDAKIEQVRFAPDELTARYRLALACVLAMEKTT